MTVDGCGPSARGPKLESWSRSRRSLRIGPSAEAAEMLVGTPQWKPIFFVQLRDGLGRQAHVRGRAKATRWVRRISSLRAVLVTPPS